MNQEAPVKKKLSEWEFYDTWRGRAETKGGLYRWGGLGWCGTPERLREGTVLWSAHSLLGKLSGIV